MGNGYDRVYLQEIWGVPKSVMPEKFSSSASSDLNKYLNKNFAKMQSASSDLVARGASEAEINETRKQLMQEVYDLSA